MEERNQPGKLKQIVQRTDLPSIFRIIGYLAVALLIIVCVLGGRQYSLYRHCEQVSDLSDKLLFQFSSIKDHLNETLIAGGRISVRELSTELQEFSGSIDQIMDDILIPREVKLSLIHPNDLVGLIVALRAVGGDSNQSSKEKRISLVSKLNWVHARLANSNRNINNYTQSLLNGLHKTLAGVLFLAIFIISSMLIIMNRFISKPILEICKKLALFQPQSNDFEKEIVSFSSLSMNTLQETVNRLLETNQRLKELMESAAHIHHIMDETSDTKELWDMICWVLTKDSTYRLAWIGHQPANQPDILPIAAAGQWSSKNEDKSATHRRLLNSCRLDSPFCRSAHLSVTNNRAEQQSILLSTLDKELLANIDCPEKQLICVSIPIPLPDKDPTILTLYRPGREPISHQEIALLTLLCNLASAHTSQQANLPIDKATVGYSSPLYQLGFIGSLTSHFTHEVINLVNGVINYTQAIFDLEKDSVSAESREMLGKLLDEEKRMGRQASALIQFIQTLQADKGHEDLSAILKQVTRFLPDLYGSGFEEYELKIDDGLPKVCNHHMEIRLSTLMLLQNCLGSRLGISENAVDTSVVIHCTLEPVEKQAVILTIQCRPQSYPDHGTTTRKSSLPWHDQSFIQDYLRGFGAELTNRTNADDQSYTNTIVLPHSCFSIE